ncbi:hypothetical protein AR687_14665 [Flavobacteriaceae bacterium CRH]|nr:hypothetical protein AR687_14665 [Flavobacteriaceae bacterium CRH]
MLTFEQARKIVSDQLANSNFSNDDSLIILDNLTIEKPYAWIFSYTSKLLHETKDDKYLIAGNSPIIVNKKTGKQTSYPSAYNEIMELYEEEENIYNLVLTDSNLLNNSKLLLLKDKMKFSYEKLMGVKKEKNFCIDKGSQSRLTSLQIELLKIGIETELIFS